MSNKGWLFSGNKKKRKKRKKRINKHMTREERVKADEEEERRDREELMNEIMEESILDIIEDEIDRRGGINGLDGETISDILSYYIANDSRFELRLQRELIRRDRRLWFKLI